MEKNATVKNLNLPGPGEYESKGALDDYFVNTGKGYSIPWKKIPNTFNVPGVGSYDLNEKNLSNKKRNPSYRIPK